MKDKKIIKNILIVTILMIMLSLNVFGVCTLTFDNQIPNDITTTDLLFGVGLNITYNVSSDCNMSTARINYLVNSSTQSCHDFVNGTCYSDFRSHPKTSNTTNQVIFRMSDNLVYPSNSQRPTTDFMTAQNGVISTLSSTNSEYRYYFSNMTCESYTFFEDYMKSSGALNYYYCNSSNSCYNYANIINGSYFNHNHSGYSFHHLEILPIVTTAPNVCNIGGVGVTPNSYIRMLHPNGVTLTAYGLNGTYKTGSNQVCNSPSSCTNLNADLDAHFHQYSDDEVYYYYITINDTENNVVTSDVRTDLFELGGLKPNSPIFILPTSETYFGNIEVEWTPAFSPNNYEIVNYTLELYKENHDLVFSVELSGDVTTYNYNTNNTANDYYHFHITAIDSMNQSSDGVSQTFYINNQLVNINMISCPSSELSIKFLFGGFIVLLMFAMFCLLKKPFVILSVFFSIGTMLLSFPIFKCNDLFGYIAISVSVLMFLISGFRLIK